MTAKKGSGPRLLEMRTVSEYAHWHEDEPGVCSYWLVIARHLPGGSQQVETELAEQVRDWNADESPGDYDTVERTCEVGIKLAEAQKRGLARLREIIAARGAKPADGSQSTINTEEDDL